ncbi:hypothetical protein DRP04_05345 [Archaeoglobales archaeon]|nr:MAG: hypothetical protein DRP04_05345 [Archaeoglobales archaeon]
MKVVVPDMGHGNCVGIFNGKDSLIVDCGTRTKKKEENFYKFIRPKLNSKKRELMITHYHTDHYNLLHSLPQKFFEETYLPALPPESDSAAAILEFLALSIATRFKDYPLIPQIIKVTKKITPLIKNDSFSALGKDWETLWPDYSKIDKVNKVRIKNLREKIRIVQDRLSSEALEEFKRWYSILSHVFSGKEVECEAYRIDIQDFEPSQGVLESLEEIEGAFRQLADRTSLVAREVHGEFLFTGDVDNAVLNNYLDFSDIEHYFLIEAPHHGGRYGSAFNNVKTTILVISRRSGYLPRPEFMHNISWDLLVDTGKGKM